jgi:hypothetical protein
MGILLASWAQSQVENESVSVLRNRIYRIRRDIFTSRTRVNILKLFRDTVSWRPGVRIWF